MTKSDDMLAIHGISVAMDNTDFLLQNAVFPTHINYFLCSCDKKNAQKQLMEETVFFALQLQRKNL